MVGFFLFADTLEIMERNFSYFKVSCNLCKIKFADTLEIMEINFSYFKVSCNLCKTKYYIYLLENIFKK